MVQLSEEGSSWDARRCWKGSTDEPRELAEHIRRVCLDNAEAILEAKNETTASLCLDGLLDTEEHRRLEDLRTRAELDHQHARREVERLQLIVRLLGTQGGGDTVMMGGGVSTGCKRTRLSQLLSPIPTGLQTPPDPSLTLTRTQYPAIVSNQGDK
jgi:hypothetical protein